MKRILVGLICSVIVALSVSADPFATFKGEKGTVEVVGCETTVYDGKNYVAVLMNCINDSGESYAPDLTFTYNAFQDGIQLPIGYVYTYKPEGFERDDTKVRPGGTLPFYELYELRNTSSPIEMEVSELFAFGGQPADCAMSLGDVRTGSEVDYTVSAVPSTDNTASDLLERIEALERRVAELEAKLLGMRKKLSGNVARSEPIIMAFKRMGV